MLSPPPGIAESNPYKRKYPLIRKLVGRNALLTPGVRGKLADLIKVIGLQQQLKQYIDATKVYEKKTSESRTH